MYSAFYALKVILVKCVIYVYSAHDLSVIFEEGELLRRWRLYRRLLPSSSSETKRKDILFLLLIQLFCLFIKIFTASSTERSRTVILNFWAVEGCLGVSQTSKLIGSIKQKVTASSWFCLLSYL